MKILNLVEVLGEGRFTCYKTRKTSLDRNDQDTLDYDDKVAVQTRNSKFAESDQRRLKTVMISEHVFGLCKQPLFRYFLDGSRHVYKIDDIAIGNRIYPFLAGQIIVGCCERKDRDTFKKTKLSKKIVLALPKNFNYDCVKEPDFCRFYCDKINEELSKNKYVCEHNILIDDIILYPTDGNEKYEKDKNGLKDSGTAKIQSEMIKEEQSMVQDLCNDNLLSDFSYLIKDGSLEYRSFMGVDMKTTQAAQMKTNYKHVVGVSKMFNPDLLPDFEGKKMSKTIANLKPRERTKAYRYEDGDFEFAVWYLRIRKEDNFRETHFSDVIKCEMMLDKKGDDIDTDLINVISANLIKEAYPTCYGSDSRWGNHLYPIYLTESFCKANYLSQDILLNLF